MNNDTIGQFISDENKLEGNNFKGDIKLQVDTEFFHASTQHREDDKLSF